MRGAQIDLVCTETWQSRDTPIIVDLLPEEEEAALAGVLLAEQHRIDQLFALCRLPLSTTIRGYVLELLRLIPLDQTVEAVLVAVKEAKTPAAYASAEAALRGLVPCDCAVRTLYCLDAISGRSNSLERKFFNVPSPLNVCRYRDSAFDSEWTGITIRLDNCCWS